MGLRTARIVTKLPDAAPSSRPDIPHTCRRSSHLTRRGTWADPRLQTASQMARDPRPQGRAYCANGDSQLAFALGAGGVETPRPRGGEERDDGALGRHSRLRRRGQRRSALRGAHGSLEQLGRSYEVIIVDDGSTRRHVHAARGLAAGDPRLKIVKLRRNYGQTAAMAAGFDHARGEVIVPMDGDLQNDPADIALLLEKIDEGYDVVSGWRSDRQDGFMRRLPVACRQLADRPRDRRAPPRLRLHAEGVSRRDRARDAALRRDAPVPPGARVSGRRADHGDSRAASSAERRQEQVRARPDVQGAARPA